MPTSSEVIVGMIVVIVITMLLTRNMVFAAAAVNPNKINVKNGDNNIFSVLNNKYSSMIPKLTSKYGAFPKPFKWIYSDDDFSRQDENDDSEFYQYERLVHHIDESARKSLTDFYEYTINNELSRLSVSSLDILDICSSWVTHYPPDMITNGKINAKGIGMNEIELSTNPAFKTENDYLVQDLNKNVMIDNQFTPNESFDIVTIAVSIDYLIKTRELLMEILRILKPNGLLILSWSNRMFWTKAIKIWTESNEEKRVYIASSFLHYYYDDGDENEDTDDNLRFDKIDAYRIDNPSNNGDPMYVVVGRKKPETCQEKSKL